MLTDDSEFAIAHEIWAAAQLAQGEGIEDGANRITAILERLASEVCSAQNAESERQDGLSLTDATQRIAELETEAAENCRIVGMSGEREARNLARITELEKEIERLTCDVSVFQTDYVKECELNIKHEATIAQQAALIDKCEKDAARYQYFRSSAAAAMYLNSTDEKLDFAIDAAIAAHKGAA